MQWYGLQILLEQTKSDVLILLDCCAAASSASSSGVGVTEVIAACGFETVAPGVGKHSFTRSLIKELEYLSRGAPFTTTLLHNKILSRIKDWKPRYKSLDQHEQWKTPVYIRLASEKKQRSIVIEPMQVQTESTSEYPETPDPPSLSRSPVPSFASQQEVDMLSSESSQSPLPDVWPDPNFKCPKVVISIALEEDQRLRPDELTEWLRSVPALANFVHVEGVYESDSVMIILSLPVAIWNLMPDDPAVSFIGFIRSRNMSMIAENGRTMFKVNESTMCNVTTKEDIKRTVTPLQNPAVIRLMRTFVAEIAIHLDFIDPAKYVSLSAFHPC